MANRTTTSNPCKASTASSPAARTGRTYQYQLTLKPPQEHSNNPHHHKEKIKCTCSPSKHPLVYKCHYHRNPKRERPPTPSSATPGYTSGNMILLKTATKNSMLNNGGKEAEFAKKNFIIKRTPPSLRRPCREALQIRPSRLSTMSNAHD